MYAQACGKTETELKVVLGTSSSKAGSQRRPSAKKHDESEEGEQSSGNEFRLRDWKERVTDEKLGEPHNGQPAPLIDRLHRLVFLFHATKLPKYKRNTKLGVWRVKRAFPAFAPGHT